MLRGLIYSEHVYPCPTRNARESDRDTSWKAWGLVTTQLVIITATRLQDTALHERGMMKGRVQFRQIPHFLLRKTPAQGELLFPDSGFHYRSFKRSVKVPLDCSLNLLSSIRSFQYKSQ